jgi:signal transduction histidine kinase
MARGLDGRKAAAPATTLAEALDAVAFGVAVQGADGAPVYANTAHAALAEAVADAACFGASRSEAAETEEIRAADGRSILRKRRRLPSGGAIETLTDITASRRRETELEAARERADAAIIARSQFISVMSHELRTPMNGVLGFAGLLAMSDLDERQQRWLAYISESGELLLRILNGILDLTALETNALEMASAPMDPAAAAGLAAAGHLAAALEKGVALSVRTAPGLPPHVLGDARRLEQALSLLIDNAVKFTPQGEVAVSVTMERAAEGRVLLCYEVRDSGPGLAPEALGHLFDAFTQADSSATRSHGGVGIGLALCRRLVEAMGGAVEADSAPGQGARFRIRIEHVLPDPPR